MTTDKLFFFPCTYCYSKLVGSVKSIAKEHLCPQCQKIVLVPEPPKRIPPPAKIASVCDVGKYQGITMILANCPYCSYQHKLSTEYRGKQIFCKRCSIAFEIPAPQLWKFTSRVTPKVVTADGRSMVAVKVIVQDKMGLSVVGEPLVFSITRANGKAFRFESKTDAQGEATIGYAAGEYSSDTEVHIHLRNFPDRVCQALIREINGIADGRLQIDTIRFSAQDESNALTANVVLNNPGFQTVSLKSVDICEVQIDGQSPRIQPWQQQWQQNVIESNSSFHIDCHILKAKPLPIKKLLVAVVVSGKNLNSGKEVFEKKHITVHIPVLPQIHLQLATTHDNCERAGQPFAVICTAMRERVPDKNFTQALPVEFATNAETAVDGSFPQVPSTTTVNFINGRAVIEEQFCFVASQKAVKLEAVFKKTEVFGVTVYSSIDAIEVLPGRIHKLRWHLCSPQKNRLVFAGTNAVEVLDVYENRDTQFCESLSIATSTGMLWTEAPLRQIPVDAGYADLTRAGMRIVVENSVFPCEVELTAAYKSIRQVTTLTLHPKPIDIIFDGVKPVEPVVEQGTNDHELELQLQNVGDADFQIDSVSFQFYQSNDTETTKSLQAFYQIRPLFSTPPQIPAHDSLTILVQCAVRKDAPPGKTYMRPVIGGRDLFDGQAYSLSGEITATWQVEPGGREFRIRSEHDAQEVAGQPFSLIISTYRRDTLDTDYHGKKTLYFSWQTSATEFPPQIEQQIEIEFVAGVARTPRCITVFQRQPLTIHIVDPTVGGSRGSFADLELIAASLAKLQTHIESPQINHCRWRGKNYFIAMDLYNNIKTDFDAPVTIASDKGEIEYGDLKNPLENICLHVAGEDVPGEVNLQIRCGDICSQMPVQINPQAQVVNIISLSSPRRCVEQQERAQKLSAQLQNSGETAITIVHSYLNFTANDTDYPIVAMPELPLAMESQQTITLEFAVDIPEAALPGHVDVYLTLVCKDNFYQNETSFSGLRKLRWQVEPADRIFYLQCTEQIIAGSPFAVELAVWRQQRPDSSYYGQHTIYFAGANFADVPEYLLLNFTNGKATTDKVFTVVSTAPCLLKAYGAGPGAPKGEEQWQSLPGKLFSLHTELADNQIANRPFFGNFALAAFDEYGNCKTDFVGDFVIHSTGDGQLQRNGSVASISKDEFQNGHVDLPAEQFCYKRSNQAHLQKIELLFKHHVFIHKHLLSITPEPAHLDIEEVRLDNQVVEWEKGGYYLHLKICNSGGASMQLISVNATFMCDDNKVESGYKLMPWQTFPQVIDACASADLSLEVALQKYVPLGLHSVCVLVETRDLFYKNTLQAEAKIENGWRVEPSGRVVRGLPIAKVRAREPFALQLEVTLEGKIDTRYSGWHVLQCHSATPIIKGCPANQFPAKLYLQFVSGKAKTNAEFTCFHAYKQLLLDFYETNAGGAAGKIPVTVHREKLGHFIARKSRDFIAFMRCHRQPILAGIVALLLLLLCIWHWQRVAATQQLQVVEIVGRVTVAGSRIQPGDIIYAQKDIQVIGNGLCVLRMPNGTLIKLYGSSHVYPASLGRSLLSSVYAPQLAIKSGDFVYQTLESVADAPQIQIPDADRLQVQSEHFRVGVQKDRSLISVYQGQVDIATGNTTVAVKQGQGSSVRKGEKPGTPTTLPPPPTWFKPSPNSTATTQAVVFMWSKVANAVHYVVEICTAAKHPVPSYNEVNIDNQLKMYDLQNGIFKCQVSCVNGDGFVGLPSRVLVFAHQPPFPARELQIVVQTDDGHQIAADKILLNGIDFANGKEVKIGKHSIAISRVGYQTRFIDIDIPKANRPFVLKCTLQSKKRQLLWQWSIANFPDFVCSPIQILQNQRPISALPRQLKPGTYEFAIAVPGFQQYRQTIDIAAGEQALLIKLHLETLPRKIKIVVEADCDVEKFAPKITMDGKILPAAIQPGTYQLQIEHPGFKTHRETVTIPPHPKPYQLQRKLQAQPREFVLQLKYSYPPPAQHPRPRVTLAAGNQSYPLAFPLRKLIKPGLWTLSVRQTGYHSWNHNFRMYPGNSSHIEKCYLHAKNITLRPHFAFSIPVADLEPKLTIYDSDNNPLTFHPELQLQPGRYRLQAIASGYHSIDTNIELVPADEDFTCKISFRAKQRRLLPMVIDSKTGERDTIVDIIGNGKQLLAPFSIEAGIEYALTVWLRKHEPITTTISLPPSEHPYQITATLNECPSFTFRIKREQIEVDGISYSVNLWADKRKIPSDMIETYDLGNFIYCEFHASKQTHTIRCQLGFYYEQVSLNTIQNIRLQHISWSALQAHLDRISTSQKIIRLRSLLQWEMDKLQQLAPDDKKALHRYLQKLRTTTDDKQMETIIALSKKLQDD